VKPAVLWIQPLDASGGNEATIDSKAERNALLMIFVAISYFSSQINLKVVEDDTSKSGVFELGWPTNCPRN